MEDTNLDLSVDKQLANKLQKFDHKTPLFNIVGMLTAKVTDVKDGDTIQFITMYNGSIQKFVGRMDGYDTQPLKKTADDDKMFAIEAMLYLQSTLWDKIVKIHSNGFDKSNNLLVVVYLDGVNINNTMVAKGFGQIGRTNRKQPKKS